MARPTECPCGSKKYPEANFDARGIFLCYACIKCEREKLKGYRPEVMTDPNYECDEQIEED